MIARNYLDHIFDLIAVLNGVLDGLVALTAICAFIEPYAAVIIGAIGAIVYIGAAETMLKLKIGDPFRLSRFTGLLVCGVS